MGRMLAVVAVVLVVAGCGATYPHRRPVTSDFDSIAPGTSSAEVERRLGAPVTKLPLPRLAQEVWDYRYFDGHTPMIVHLHFDLGGSLRQRRIAQDTDYYHGGAAQ